LKTGSVSSLDVLNGGLTVTDIADEDVTQGVNLGPIAGGACTDFTIQATTLEDKPMALVNPPGNFYDDGAGLVFNWHVGINQDDDVEVHVCNITAAPIDPPNGGWRAILFTG
jgi:hypothetical protein